MKKTILILFCSAITVSGFSQSDVSGFPFGHQRQPGRYVGWSPGFGSVAGSLDVKNNFVSQPINFFAGGSTAAFQRMTILGTNGFVGIGNSFNTPANRLHLFQPSGTFGLQITNTTTGNSATNGFSMNLLGAGPDIGEFQFTQHFNRNVAFIMPQTANPLMELTWNLGPSNFGQVQMRPISNPIVGVTPIYNAAQLNIGGAIGFSPQVTTTNTNTLLYHNTSIAGATNDPAEDGFRVQYAFSSEGNPNGDCLVFEKTDGQSAFPDGCIKFTNYGTDNLQRLSMTIEGDGHVGIGRPYMATISPWRRLTVDDTDPQLRLSYLASTAVNTDIYTDFFTDATGNLLIDPRNGGDANAGVVRINYGTGLTQPFPGLSLDVNGQANIRTVNADNATPFVLVWDQATGNVRYRDINTFPSGGGGITGAHNGTSMSTIIPTNVAFGQNLNEPLNPGELLNDREVPMNDNNIVFTNTLTANNSMNRIGIGTQSPLGKLHIESDGSGILNPQGVIIQHTSAGSVNSYGMVLNVSGNNNSNVGHDIFVAPGTTNNAGVVSRLSGSGGPNSDNYAYQGDASITTTGINYGNFSIARYGQTNFGGQFIAQSNNSANNYGIYASASGDNTTNSAGYFVSNGDNNTVSYGIEARSYGNNTSNIGVFAFANGTTGTNIGIRAHAINGTGNYAAWFDEKIYVQGYILNNGVITPSDTQFKTNVNTLDAAMTLINQLQPKSYLYDTTNYADFNFESDQQMGLIAQEVEQIIPAIVSIHVRPAQYDSLGVQTLPELIYKGVEYEELIPLLIAGMQEQDNRIDSLTTVNSSVTNYSDSLEQVVSSLNARLTLLENCLSNILPALCNANQMAVQQTPEEVQQQLRAAINVNLSDRNAIVLNQNVPNPFAESTVITFTIPGTVQKAQIHFYDGTGKLINSVDVVERGNGQLNVFANDLSTGVYTYSLVADGQVVSTKRMMKQ